ncbi:MAG: hypothetical protein CO127_10110 [Ignavibacteria bacterium CG_4_9_14_3_um_filter_36_18]|nr:MAG: hypothetical protein CO127_10110 [Ignavibacteria bacterium CG_4_9_14_3_um_filter_36_18]
MARNIFPRRYFISHHLQYLNHTATLHSNPDKPPRGGTSRNKKEIIRKPTDFLCQGIFYVFNFLLFTFNLRLAALCFIQLQVYVP